MSTFTRSGLALLLGLATFAPSSLQAAMPLEEALELKPVLSNLLYNRARIAEAGDALGLTREERSQLEALVFAEKAALLELQREALPEGWSAPAADGLRIDDFNHRMLELARASARELRTLLPLDYPAFLEWGQARWDEDSRRGGVEVVRTGTTATLQYTVYATQYDAYTPNEVAVPDKYVKFAAQGTQYHSGYPQGGNYNVILDRSTYSYKVRVYEVGPWNIDDNYWNAANDPERPRRLFTDLPQGKPEAQAAYYDHYNNGKDQSGRTVGNPAGVDLAVEVAPKIGLAYLENDWVKVTYLWEDGSSTTPQTGNLVGYVREGDIYNGKAIVATVKLSTGQSTTTDSNGYYKFTGLNAGSVTVTASASCYKTASVTKSVQAGVDTWASIALSPEGCGPGVLAGYVREGDAEQGMPVAGAKLTLSNGATATTASSGYYTFNSVAAGSYTLNVSAECYASKSTGVVVSAGATAYQNVGLEFVGCGDDGGDGDSGGCSLRTVMRTGGREGALPSGASTGVLFGAVAASILVARRRRR